MAHPADPGTQEVFQWIKKIPDRENRVIGVITKCDRKQEGAENWVSSADQILNILTLLKISGSGNDQERTAQQSTLFNSGMVRVTQPPTYWEGS